MNNTILGNSSSQPFCVNLNSDVTAIPNIAGPIIQLPVNIYILQLIISRHWITSEFYTFKTAIFDFFICFHNILGAVMYFYPNTCLRKSKRFFLGFIVTGRPSLLTVICVERYLAIVKPLIFIKLKPVKYKLVLSGIILLLTLVSCCGSAFMRLGFHYTLVVQMTVNCVVKLYCCVATLLVLKQPGPGDGVRQREGLSNMKQRAFRIILIITVSLIFTYVPLMIVIIFKGYLTQQMFMYLINMCYTCTSFSGFVQSMLFLQRSGKVPCFKWS